MKPEWNGHATSAEILLLYRSYVLVYVRLRTRMASSLLHGGFCVLHNTVDFRSQELFPRRHQDTCMRKFLVEGYHRTPRGQISLLPVSALGRDQILLRALPAFDASSSIDYASVHVYSGREIWSSSRTVLFYS